MTELPLLVIYTSSSGVNGSWGIDRDMSKRTYSDEQKAAVMAALLAGQSVREVAREYHIPHSTVAGWSAKMNRQQVADPATKKELGALILEYLHEVLGTLILQQTVFRDEGWLRKQQASELAVLHGVLTDKAIRLLEAFDGDEDEDAGL